MSDIEETLRKKGFVSDGNGGYKPKTYDRTKHPMIMGGAVRINLKPLSVNAAYTGKRYKTEAYRKYCKEVAKKLPYMVMPPPPYQITFKFGFSSSQSDWDNPVKPIQDIISKFYGFNDKLIHRGITDKILVPKGNEFFEFSITTLDGKDS